MAAISRYGQTNPSGKNNAVIKASFEMEQKYLDQMAKKHLETDYNVHTERLKLLEELRKAQVDAIAKGNKDEEIALQAAINAKLQLEKEYQDKLAPYKANAIEEAIKLEATKYNNMTARKRMEASKAVKTELEDRKKLIEGSYGDEIAEFRKLQQDKDSLVGEAKTRYDELVLKVGDLESELTDIDANLPVAENAFKELFNSIGTSADRAKQAQEEYTKSKEIADEEQAAFLSFEREQLKKIHAARLKGDFAEAKSLQTELKDRKAIADAAQEQADADKHRFEKAEKAAKKDEERQKRKDEAEKKRQELQDRFTNVNVMSKKIEENLNTVSGERAKLMARLQGSTEDWGKAVDSVSDSIGFSGIVSKKSVISKMAELVDSGIAYNIELRAFLATTSENIASTFNALDGTLLRMIRLQQADTTAARLGMEATLTKLFNQLFNDTSYLKDASDAVSQAILDASANLDRDQSLEFEYTMQKWLGSLYSLGVSSEGVSRIATAVNYLGSGNYSALSNDSSMLSLLTLGGSYGGGKTIDQMLHTGLTADDTNKLLRGIIEYLSDIVRNQSSNVTTSAYADLFNMSVTDLRAFSSLTMSDIEQLYDNTVSYQTLVNETESQLSKISSRMSLTELVDNAINNAELSIATSIGGNAFTYATWKALGLLTDYVGEIKIPSVLAAGFGLSSDIDLLNVAKTGMIGFGAISSLVGAIKSMSNGGASSLDAWDFSEYTQRGSTLSLLTPEMLTTSYSERIGVGGGSGSDIETVSLESAKDKAYKEGQTSQEGIEEGKEIPQKIYDALAGDSLPNVLSLLQDIDDRLDYGRVFYTAITSQGMSTNAVSQINNLSTVVAAARSTTESEEDVSTTASSTQSVNSTGTSLSAQTSYNSGNSNDMQDIITAAVEQALRNIAGYSSGTGLPVTVTNLTNGGLA